MKTHLSLAHSRRLVALTLAATVFSLGAAGAHAALLAYEGFSTSDYNTGADPIAANFPTDDLRGQGPNSGTSFGFTGVWKTPTINGASPSFDYWSNVDNLTASNYYRAAGGQSGYNDSLGQPLITTPGRAVFQKVNSGENRNSIQRDFTTGTSAPSTLYMSTLIDFEPGSRAYLGLASVNVGSPGGTGTRPFQFGIVDDGRLFAAGHTSTGARAVVTSSANDALGAGTYLLVAKFTDDGFTNDTLELWVNPVLGDEFASGPPDLVLNQATGNADLNFYVAGNPSWAIQGLVLEAGGGATNSIAIFDELRIGTTWESVTPVPEPGRALLLAGALMACAVRRQR